MPTVLKSGPYRLYFYSHDGGEPPHIHVDRERVSAKFWLELLGSVRMQQLTSTGRSNRSS